MIVLDFKNACDQDLAEVLSSEQSIAQFVFDLGHVFPDIYWCFDRVMQFGIKHLYQVTKDMATLKREICQQLNIDQPANSQKNENHEIQQRMRELLEKAYDEEKAKSVMSKKCSRIYHTLLKARDPELYEHLIEN